MRRACGRVRVRVLRCHNNTEHTYTPRKKISQREFNGPMVRFVGFLHKKISPFDVVD
jgi:hypothetical protein